MNIDRFAAEDLNRVILTGDDFHKLVRGGVVRVLMETQGPLGITRRRIAIALSDIGFDQMHMLIEEAEGLR